MEFLFTAYVKYKQYDTKFCLPTQDLLHFDAKTTRTNLGDFQRPLNASKALEMILSSRAIQIFNKKPENYVKITQKQRGRI